MRTGRPWKYEIDIFGLAATAYVLLHGEYMELTYERRARDRRHDQRHGRQHDAAPRGGVCGGDVGRGGGMRGDMGEDMGEDMGRVDRSTFRPSKPFPRYWQRSLWEDFFDFALNGRSSGSSGNWGPCWSKAGSLESFLRRFEAHLYGDARHTAELERALNSQAGLLRKRSSGASGAKAAKKKTKTKIKKAKKVAEAYNLRERG